MPNKLLSAFGQFSLLQKTLAVSVALHAGLLTVRFVDPEGFNRAFKDTPLEVILVNAASEQKPDKAQALAQANLAGGGDADKGRATSPLPPSPQSELGDSLDATRRMIEDMEAEQRRLLAELKGTMSALPVPQPQAPDRSNEHRSERETRRQDLDQFSQIEKRIVTENARPKKRYISPSTLKVADALYYSNFRTVVERAGTTNFPTINGRKLYGELVMEVAIDETGRILDATVTQSSGDSRLDKRAISIVKKLGSFGVVPQEVMAGHQQLLISSRFKFTRDAALETVTTGLPPPATGP
ncbi:MAG TPA: energy transducer TonB [Candidatus Aquabacterium excrementipullorum]|nr:energy transducer TonB [Candidatus Aquabacterium excrementipullorum]